MTERLLQYIWQFQHFNSKSLLTDEGEALQIIHPGVWNSNQGPDFLAARIRIGNTLWAGSIELHIHSADWRNHGHGNDSNYKNVILHVVWRHDIDLNLPFSTLSLQDKVSKLLLKRYDELMNAGSFIPCEKKIHLVKEISLQSWKERLVIERLQAKTRLVSDHLQKNNNHWEETLWWLIARNFGAKLNADAFEKMAQSIPINILSRHKSQIQQAEALVFGQAGLLDREFEEDYPKLLRKEYRFLKKKYGLQKVFAPFVFLRMRPGNFPTVRLAQLAMLVHESLHLFSKIRESSELTAIKALLRVTANDYWHYHYVFDQLTAFRRKKLGEQMIDNILVNTVIPVLFAYGQHHADDACKDKALKWLEELDAEKNAITAGFISLQMKNSTAFDSQAYIQLKNEYCNRKRCLDCVVGNKLLREDG